MRITDLDRMFGAPRGPGILARPDAAEPHFFIPPTSGTSGNGKPVFDWDEAAHQLTRTGASWSATEGTPVTITYAFRASAPANMPDDAGGFSKFTAAQIAASEEALDLWADVANITFTRVGGNGYSNAATILFGNYSTGVEDAAAFAYLAAPNGKATGRVEGDVWVNISQEENQNPINGSYGAQTLAHEIGHAIGLEHPGDYDGGDPDYDGSAVYWQDARMFTIMSYFGSSNTGGNLPAFAAGPQLHDIAAAQLLYGANMTTRTGNTTYGFHSNTGHAATTITSSGAFAVFAIWDAGGVDTLNLSGYTTPSEIDLRAEGFSNAGPADAGTLSRGNIAIARGVVIENAIGGAGNDKLIGNNANNKLDGGGGDDTMIGGKGNDTYVVNSSAGDQVLESSGSGKDTVQCRYSYTLGSNIENLTLVGTGSSSLTGNSLDNVITGNSKANALDGGAGDDTLRGGNGGDVYKISSSSADTVVESAGGSGVDTVKTSFSCVLAANVENLVLVGTGSSSLTGNGLDNVITGNSKGNAIDGRAGEDTLVGGAGNDVYTIQSSAADTVVEAVNGGIDTVKTSFSATLTANVENLVLIGTGASSLTGNDLENVITGNAKSNMIAGGAGADAFVFASALSASNIDTITDFAAGQDEVRLENDVFTALTAGALSADQFHIGAAAADGDDFIIYDDATGALYYDADGDGAGTAIQFATLSAGLVLTSDDFAII